MAPALAFFVRTYIHLNNSARFYYSILPFDGGTDDAPNGVVDCDELFSEHGKHFLCPIEVSIL